MGAYARPYIPGVYVAIGGAGGGPIAAPRLNSALQRSPVSKLVSIPYMKGFVSTDEGDGGVGPMKTSVAGMCGDRGDAGHEENDGEEENAHLSI